MRLVNQTSGPHLEVEPITASIFARFLQFLYFLWAVAFFFGFMCAEILEELRQRLPYSVTVTVDSYSKIATGGVVNLIIKSTAIPIAPSVQNY